MQNVNALKFEGIRYNTVLDDVARQNYQPLISLMSDIAPEIMSQKYSRANVQQAFTLNSVLTFAHKRSLIVCAGSFMDTAFVTLQKLGYNVIGFDPSVDGLDMAAFIRKYPHYQNQVDVVFSTSVIEHVADDIQFVKDAEWLLKPGGYMFFTCDFLNSWKPGARLPSSDCRLYTSDDLNYRLPRALPLCEHVDAGDWEKFSPDFDYEGMKYSFASLSMQKGFYSEFLGHGGYFLYNQSRFLR